MQRFLAGSASILTIKYNSKDIDTIRSGCKLAFRYKNRDYWLNVMSFEKKGFEVELTAYSLGLELNNETRGEHKPANAMSITEYVAYYDPEHALTIGVNEVSDKRIKLEWTGTDTILARLFSVANSFGAELDFNVELNDDYSLKRQVLNIYKKGNLGTNKLSQPVRVGKELKVINYSDNIKELRTAVRATGKDGLTIDGLDKKIYDNNKELLYYSSGMTVYAPQSRDRFPSVGKGSNDNWIVEDLGETQYETKEALWGYMYGEIQKKSLPEITYEVEGAIEAGIGDTQTLIDDIHFEPTLYVQARVSELEDDILTGKVTKSTFINFERKYSQIADILLKQVEALAEDAAPYIIRLSTNNGYIFKNGEGSSTITARLEKYSKDIAATWKWVVDNKVVGTGDKLTVKAEQVTNTMAVTVIAYVNGNEVVRDYMTFSNSDDGVGVESIDRYFTSSDQSDGVTIEGAEWSDKPPAPTEDGKYLWAYDEITYTDGTVTTTKPAAVGANFDVDAFRAEIAEDLKDVPNREEFENKIAEELANSKAEIETQIETAKTQAESNAKEYADTINEETAKVAELANAAAGEIKADLVNVKNNLTSTSIVANNAQAAVDEAKQDLIEVASELNTAKQELTSHAQQLQTQANAQTELTKRVTTVETTANGTKTTVSELSKTVDSNTKSITSVTARTKVVEDDLTSTKTTLSQVKTTADSTSQKTATLETGLNGLSAKFDSLKVGSVNLLKNSKTFKGSNIIGQSTILNETYQGCTVRYLKNTNPNSPWQELAQFNNCVYPKLGGEYVASFWAKGSGELSIYFHGGATSLLVASGSSSWGDSTTRYDGELTLNLTADWERYWVKYKLKTEPANAASFGKHLLFRHNNSSTEDEIYLAGVQLEEGNIATDYSPNEADLEQKVAEYKQTADQNYASLQSNLQTLDGTVKQNKSEFDQTASQIKSSISAVESKIPTEIGAVNLLRNSKSFSGSNIIGSGTLLSETYQGCAVRYLKVNREPAIAEFNNCLYPKLGGKYVASFWAKGNGGLTVFFHGNSGYLGVAEGLSSEGDETTRGDGLISFNLTADWKRYWVKYKMKSEPASATNVGKHLLFRTLANGLENEVYLAGVQLEEGNVVSGYEPAPEDTASQISSLSSEIKQTADGITLLATKTELNTAKNELQSGINTATNKANSNAQTISTHTTQISALNTGLSAKVSQSDFNTLSGRVTTAENNITAKANELRSKITSVEGKIPASVSQRNLIRGTSDSWSPFVDITTKNNWLWDLATVRYGDNTGIYPNTTINIFVYLSADNIVLDSSVSPRFFIQGAIINKNGDETWTDWDKYHPFHNKWSTNLGAGNNYRIVKISSKVTSESYSNINGFKIGVRIDGVQSGKFHHRALMVTTGDVFPDYWQPAPEDYDSKLATAQSEIKQTTDSIKASVQSLDNNTVKSSSLTINTDGVVIKAGKSTSDFANAVGSYFSVNPNAINLFSDKINVKGNMIVSGAITSDKIASKQINTAHLNGKIITADVISSNAVTADAIKAGAVTTDKMSANSINGDRITAGTLDAAKIKAGSISASQIASGTLTSEQIKAGAIKSINIEASAITSDKIAANSISSDKIVASGITANVIKGGVLQSLNGSTNFELDTGKLFYNNNNTGVFRIQDGASTMGLKFSNTSISVAGTSRILSRAILGGDRRETTLDDGKWDKGGFSGIVIETIKGVEPTDNEQADALRVIADNIYFTHTYSNDSLSARGWKMETYSPDSSYSGNIVLKPYGINYRQSDIVVGDIRLDNGDGSGYWMRATINTLKACFGHILNGGTSSQALNAIRSELNKISGT